MNMNYQNPYYPQRPYPMNNGIIWVQGLEGAKAYQLVPNSNVVLLDSENDGLFYIKLSDNVGMCTLRTFKYEEITNNVQQSGHIDTSNFVTREEFNNLIQQLGGIDNEQSISTNKPTITK